MKTTLFIITATLFSGIVFAQQATVKTTQSATVNSKSVNGSGSASVQTDAAAKSAQAAGKVKTEVKQTADQSAKAAANTASSVKTDVSNTTSATVKSAHNTTTATTKVVKSDIKSADAGVKTKAKVVTSPSIKAGSAVKTSVKTPPVKVASNLKVGIK